MSRNNPTREQLQAVAKEFADFNGVDVEFIDELEIDALPGVVWSLGELVEVVYRAPRYQGAPQEFKHTFKARARPTLAVTPNGELFIVGGRYRVGERGIVDLTR